MRRRARGRGAPRGYSDLAISAWAEGACFTPVAVTSGFRSGNRTPQPPPQSFGRTARPVPSRPVKHGSADWHRLRLGKPGSGNTRTRRPREGAPQVEAEPEDGEGERPHPPPTAISTTQMNDGRGPMCALRQAARDPESALNGIRASHHANPPGGIISERELRRLVLGSVPVAWRFRTGCFTKGDRSGPEPTGGHARGARALPPRPSAQRRTRA